MPLNNLRTTYSNWSRKLKGNGQETDASNGEKRHQTSCDEASAITSDEFGHRVPPFSSNKTTREAFGSTPGHGGTAMQPCFLQCSTPIRVDLPPLVLCRAAAFSTSISAN